MSGAAPSAAIVVVSWNGGDLLAACLASVVGQGLPVVLVDNDSADGSADRAEREHPGLRVVRLGTNRGFAAGVNAGVRAADADLVLLINPDAVATPDWAARMTAPFAEPGAQRLGAVTGRVLLDGWFAADGTHPALVAADGSGWSRVAADDEPPPPGASRRVNSTGNEVTRSGNGRDRDWLAPADAGRPRGEVFGLNGGSAALRTEALRSVGGFDESLFLYYEDTDLSWRLRLAGWRIEHQPEAVTVHRHAASSGTGTWVFRFHNARNRLVVADRHAPAGVALRAWLRTAAGALRPADRAVRLRAMASALARLPGDLRLRRALGRAAVVPRRVVARWLVGD